MVSIAFFSCAKLKRIILTASLTEIDDYAFQGCKELSSIILPENLTLLGVGVFQNCFNLTSIELPKGITRIRALTFCYCVNLTTLILSEHITRIDDDFFNCINLNRIVIPTDDANKVENIKKLLPPHLREKVVHVSVAHKNTVRLLKKQAISSLLNNSAINPLRYCTWRALPIPDKLISNMNQFTDLKNYFTYEIEKLPFPLPRELEFYANTHSISSLIEQF